MIHTNTILVVLIDLFCIMEHTRNGDLKGSSYDQELLGRRRNGAFPIYLDLTSREAAAIDAARQPLPPKSTPSRRRTYADGELDVFSAERYFKGAMDGDAAHNKEAVVVAARPAVPVSKPAWTCASAASAGSGGTSAHSRTVLLRDAHRRPPGGYYKCCLQVGELLRPCAGKRAVRIDGGAPEAAAGVGSGKPAAASRIEWYRDLRMEKAAAGTGLPQNSNLGAAKVAAVGREDIIKAAEHPSASFRSFTLQAPVKAVGGGSGNGDDDDGGGSESSSELFEIKSLMIDDCCPYEPSEASIQWSVVTASAVDVYSERGRRGGPMVKPQNRPVGLLTGCVSRRAVDVSGMPDARRFAAPPPRRRVAPP